MFKAFLTLLIKLNRLLKFMFINLLNFLNWLQNQLTDMYEAIKDYLLKLLKVSVALLKSFSKLMLFYMPGLLLILISDSLTWQIVGLTYVVIITLIGLFYSKTTDSEPVVDVGLTWMTFFPVEWSNDADFAYLLQQLIDAYEDIKLTGKSSENKFLRQLTKQALEKLEENLNWTAENVGRARKLRKLKKKIKDSSLAKKVADKIESLKEKIQNNLNQVKELQGRITELEQSTSCGEDAFQAFKLFEDEIIVIDEFVELAKKSNWLTSRR